MNRIKESDFFARYLDEPRAEAAEWGAFVGLRGRDHESAIGEVRKLANIALARAGLRAPERLAAARRSHEAIGAARAAIRQRLYLAYGRFIGTTPFSSIRLHRNVIECVIDILASVGLPIVLAASWPLLVARRWRLHRAERAEGAVARLAQAAEDRLVVEFEWQFVKGDEVRRLGLSARGGRAQTGKDMEHDNEAAA